MVRKSSGEWDYIGDVEILRLLEESRKAFEAGNKSELMMCVFRCAAFQAVIPEWAADALIALRENMENGRVADFNKAFESNKPTLKANTRAARARIEGGRSDVLAEILQLRTKGSSFNDDEMFSQVVTNLRQRRININHRDVQTIYKSDDAAFLKKIPRGPDPNGNHGFALQTLPRPRRHGRNILWDQEAD